LQSAKTAIEKYGPQKTLKDAKNRVIFSFKISIFFSRHFACFAGTPSASGWRKCIATSNTRTALAAESKDIP
jgi:hypothetical protein